ncbi:MAG: DoxX family protein [Pseudonocardia sp.]|nr:DoxX family protein [Pseudonocardia sp.]
MTSTTSATASTNRVTNRVLWGFQILVGLFFIVASAAPKFFGEAYAVETFTQIGAGQWFRYLVAVLELAGGIGLLTTRLAAPAALGLMGLMIGAAFTQAVVLDAPAMILTPAILFVVLAAIAWGRRAQLTAQLPSRAG